MRSAYFSSNPMPLSSTLITHVRRPRLSAHEYAERLVGEDDDLQDARRDALQVQRAIAQRERSTPS